MCEPASDTHVELLEFPDAHNVVLVLVECVEHGVGLFVSKTELGLEHRHGFVSLQSSNVVVDVPIKYLLHLFPATH